MPTFTDLIEQGLGTMPLGVADPTTGSGIAADIGTVGRSNTDPATYWKKTGAADTAWTGDLNADAVRNYVPLGFPGRLAVGQTKGYSYAEVARKVYGIVVDNVEDGPVGDDIQVKVIDADDVELVAAATLVADGATRGRLIFGAELTQAAGDELLIEITQVGSTAPGSYLTGAWIVQPLTQ